MPLLLTSTFIDYAHDYESNNLRFYANLICLGIFDVLLKNEIVMDSLEYVFFGEKVFVLPLTPWLLPEYERVNLDSIYNYSYRFIQSDMIEAARQRSR
jgi:hypothetical protein